MLTRCLVKDCNNPPKETTWGTAVSPTKDIGLIQNISINESNTLQTRHAIASRSPQAITHGNYDGTGSMSFIIQHTRMLEYIFGTVAHNTSNTPDILHTFTHKNALPSFTLEDGYNGTTDAVQTYAGCLVTSATIGMEVGGVLTLDADFLFKTVANTTAANAAVIDTVAVLPAYMATLKTGTATSEATVSNVQSFSITVDNAAKKFYSIGNRLAQTGVAGPATYKFDFKMAFADQTEYELFLGSTAPNTASAATLPSIVFDVTNGVAAASGLRQFYLNLRGASYSEVGKETTLDDWVYASFTGEAYTLTSCFGYDDVGTASW